MEQKPAVSNDLGLLILNLATPVANAFGQMFARRLADSLRRKEVVAAFVGAIGLMFEPGVVAAPVKILAERAAPKASNGKTSRLAKVPCCTACHRPGHRKNKCTRSPGREARTPATKGAGTSTKSDDEPPPVPEVSDLAAIAAALALRTDPQSAAEGVVLRGRKCSPFGRAKTTNFAKLPRRERGVITDRTLWDVPASALRDVGTYRPKTRGDCLTMPRPCPFVGCRHHMALVPDIERDSLKEVFPELRIVDDPEGPGLHRLEKAIGTCVLDIADQNGDGVEGVAGLLNLFQIASSGKDPRQTHAMTIEETGKRLNISKERTDQLTGSALQDLRWKLRVRRLNG